MADKLKPKWIIVFNDDSIMITSKLSVCRDPSGDGQLYMRIDHENQKPKSNTRKGEESEVENG